MTKTIEMTVSLKVPDTTAITALQTLQKLGFNKIKDVKRADYYKFLVEGDEEKFREKISKVDILVNANKHSFDFSIREKIEDFLRPENSKNFLWNKNNAVKILVKNINDDGSSLLSTLKNRLGFDNIKKAEKAVLWSLSIEAEEKEAKKIAEKAARDLLVNEHYQEYVIL